MVTNCTNIYISEVGRITLCGVVYDGIKNITSYGQNLIIIILYKKNWEEDIKLFIQSEYCCV